jgi:hypothetical protein
MTNEKAKHKMDFLKKAYQKLIDEKVDSGKLVGDGVRGEWKAETPLDEAYKDIIEALDMAIEALEQQPCDDAISREAVDKYIIKLMSGYLYEEERERLEEFSAYIWELPSVTPTRPKGRWLEQQDIHKHHYGWSFCSECGAFLMSSDGANYCSCCGSKMEVDG